MKPKSKILIIAGSDSSGGAGIQADIKTTTILGSYAMTAITAITSQNTKGVKSVVSINHKEISNQINFTCEDIKPDAIKIGMLQNYLVAKSVLKSIKITGVKKIILDPVIVSTSGVKLIDNKSIEFIKKKFIHYVTLITPNIPEAELITGLKIKNVEDMIKVSKKLIQMGANNVLLKGGHLKSKIVYDILMDKKKYLIFKNKKYKTKNTHGTGCTLSTAIATFYSCGKDLNKSCALAIKYVNSAIRTAPKYGKGNGPINHLTSIKIKKII